MERWSGKVAAVTGASTGIGAAICRDLVKNGVKVVGLARTKSKLDDLKKELGAEKFYPVQCDVTKEQDIYKAFQWIEQNLKAVDILVNNAGVALLKPVLESPLEDSRKVVDTNLIAPVICSKEYVKSIKKRNASGHIFNINSVAGHYAECFTVPLGMYACSKYGLTALSAELRHELAAAKLNVKVTNISPGAVLTDMLRGVTPTKEEDLVNSPLILRDTDISNAVIYALGAPPGAEVYELTIVPTSSPIGMPSSH